jgi:hypothetical protein
MKASLTRPPPFDRLPSWQIQVTTAWRVNVYRVPETAVRYLLHRRPNISHLPLLSPKPVVLQNVIHHL